MPEASEKYRLLMKATSDAVYDYDLVSNHIEWNENLRLFGYEPSDVEPGLEWWANRVHPEDKEASLASLDASIRGNEGFFSCTYRFRCADGSYRFVADKGYILKNSEGHPLRLVGATQDVHIYEQIFNRNPHPMWVFHRESLRFLAVNEVAIRLYGYSREEFLRMDLTEIRPPEDIPLLRASVLSLDREYECLTIWRHFTKAGKLLRVEVRTQEFEFFGQPARMAMITDVTRRISVESELRESQKLNAIGQLAAGLAHDFNRYLAAIQTEAQQALNAPDADRPRLEAIELAASNALALTEQLLSFASLQPNRSQPLVWSQVVLNMEPLLRSLLAPAIRLQIVTHTASAVAKLDLQQAQQILFNLVTNARDAILAEGEVTITSALVQMDSSHPDFSRGRNPGAYLQITVADTGIGMSDSIQSHVFEPFFTTKPEGQGTGLGLSTVYGIVQQNQGWIRFDSEPGEGTEFRIYLPALSA